MPRDPSVDRVRDHRDDELQRRLQHRGEPRLHLLGRLFKPTRLARSRAKLAALAFRIPRDLVVINETDLAPHVGASLDVMARDARAMRGDGPFVFAQANRGVGLPEICEAILGAWREVVPCR